jgi:hypothetical protein
MNAVVIGGSLGIMLYYGCALLYDFWLHPKKSFLPYVTLNDEWDTLTDPAHQGPPLVTSIEWGEVVTKMLEDRARKLP